jgi:adenylate cyclase
MRHTSTGKRRCCCPTPRRFFLLHLGQRVLNSSFEQAYHALGRRAESDAALTAVVNGGAQDYASEIADAYAYREQPDEAFAWLERAYRQKDTGLYLIKVDMVLARLKSDPRYAAFLRKMNLPE